MPVRTYRRYRVELRDRVIAFLSENHVCVIATSGPLGPWAVSAHYENSGLELNSCLPHWSDALFNLQQEPHVMVVIQTRSDGSASWLQYRGVAHTTASTGSPYFLVRITPERIDLIHERAGWGARETLDL